MSSRPTAEALLISALVNSQDVLAAQAFGFTEHYMVGYPAEYKWLVNHVKIYDSQPSRDLFLSEFPEFPMCSHEDVRSAVDQVFKAYGRRQMTESMTEAYDFLSMGDLELAWGALRNAEPRRTEPKPRKLLTDLDFLDDWDKPVSYVELPYPTLQRATGGIRPGNLVYLAARPRMGKTAHLVNIVKHAVLAGNRVRFFSLEMSEDEVRGRFHAAMATHFGIKGITLDDIRSRRVDRHAYKEFVQLLDEKLSNSGGDLNIWTPQNGPVTPGQVRAGADEYHLSVVDYIGLMKTDGNTYTDDWRADAHISNSLKETSLAANTGILAAAQINREGDSANPRTMPTLLNLAKTDALGQDGDAVITMKASPHYTHTRFLLDKNRHGPSGVMFQAIFDPNQGIFTEISEDTAEALEIDKEAAL